MNEDSLFERYFYTMILGGGNLTDTDRQSLGSPFDEFVISCIFNSFFCDNSNWVWYFDYYYGNCWRFNSGVDNNGSQIDKLVSTKGGRWNGLVLTYLRFFLV